MNLSIATSAFPGDLPRKLQAIAAAGFTGVALCEQDFTCFDGTSRDIARLVSDNGLIINILQPFENLEGLQGSTKSHAFDRLERVFDRMGELQTDLLLVRAATDAEAGGADEIEQDLSDLADRAVKRGLRVAYLAHPWARHIREETQALAQVQAVDSPALGIALNSFFSLADGSRPARLAQMPGDKIFHVQLSDGPRIEMEMQNLEQHFRLLPGQGDLNLAGFLRVLARAGYKGPWTLDGASEMAMRTGETAVAVDSYRALVSLLDAVQGTGPEMEFSTPALPARVRARGIEFVEFAADEASADDLRQMLSALRFRKERQHRSKAVELWRQGAINIVINTETEGYAHSAHIAHGPTVCDMGLRVEDANATARRAEALGSTLFDQPVGAGQLDIPAIRGVGGNVVHFIDEKSDLHRVWDIEFYPVSRTQAQQPAGLRRIDHLAQTMRHEEMQSWLLFYLTTFEMEKSPVVDVTDPAGHVYSQAIQSPEGELRLNLNGTDAGRTVAGAFIADKFGAGVQHIAFLSDDIFETSELLAASGFKRLALPANYYASLQSAFGLDDALIAQLQAGNILYSRNGSGEYFQIYSQAIFGGFFFEIVQRKGSYAGYGARNAPVRAAAQSRLLRPAGLPLR